MKERSILNEIKERAENVILGQETQGVVQYALKDQYDSSIYHVLLITDGGEEKHFIFKDKSIVIVNREGSTSLELASFSLSIGDPLTIRTHGKGMIFLPWSKAERDPFNLKPEKRK